MSNLSAFLEEFELDEGAAPVSRAGMQTGTLTAAAVLALIGGRSFNLGIFRTFSQERTNAWNEIVGYAFPAFRGIVHCVGFGWDGRIIAEVLESREDIERGMAVFNPATAECLNAASSLDVFLNEDLVDDDVELLDAERHLAWLEAGNNPPQYDECVGYDVPMFVGGKEDVSNMSIIDLEVYWDISKELVAQYFESEDGDMLSI